MKLLFLKHHFFFLIILKLLTVLNATVWCSKTTVLFCCFGFNVTQGKEGS